MLFCQLRNFMKKLKSLTIFFPFLNDEGTVERQIHLAYTIGKRLTQDLEIIAIHGGASQDKTKQKIYSMKKIYPALKIIDKSRNTEGYAVIKHGFSAASKEWVFYTDGDSQYHLEADLEKLILKQHETSSDVINGYKIKRKDNFYRRILGSIYAFLSKFVFNLTIRDV